MQIVAYVNCQGYMNTNCNNSGFCTDYDIITKVWDEFVKKEAWIFRHLQYYLTAVIAQIMDLFLVVYSLKYVPEPRRKSSYWNVAVFNFGFFFGGGVLEAAPSLVLGHHSEVLREPSMQC